MVARGRVEGEEMDERSQNVKKKNFRYFLCVSLHNRWLTALCKPKEKQKNKNPLRILTNKKAINNRENKTYWT